MTELFFIPGMCVVILVALLLGSGCTTGFPDGNPTTTSVPVIVTPVTGRADCGVTPCHGLDLTCGPRIPEVCTEVYQLGDKCRQFANCTMDGRTCRIVTTPEFDTCKSCVLMCLNESRNDPSKSFACEETC
ncbi:MAG: hypothetical protein WC294_07935 [Methanoregula sp.]